MKKHILLIVIIIISIIFSKSIVKSYKPYKNMLITKATISSYEQYNNLMNYPETQTNVENLDMYKEDSLSTIESGKRLTSKVSTGYKVTGDISNQFSIKIIEGRFIYREDYNNRNNFAVISKNMAIDLFLNTKCLGKEITINNIIYEICGVYDNENNIVAKMGVVMASDTQAVFYTSDKPAPLNVENKNKSNLTSVGIDRINQNGNNNEQDVNAIVKGNEKYTIFIKTRNGSSTTINSVVQNQLKNITGDSSIEIKNMDIQVYIESQKILLLRMIVFLFIVYFIFKIIYKAVKEVIMRMKEKMKNDYFKNVLLNNRKLLIKKLIIYIFIIFLIYYVYGKIKFNMVVNPNIIPESLINYKDFFERINAFFVQENISVNFNTQAEAIFRQTRGILTYLCLIIFIGFVYYFNKIKKICLNRKNELRIFYIDIKVKIFKTIGIIE